MVTEDAIKEQREGNYRDEMISQASLFKP
jgi:hypothetical protein